MTQKIISVEVSRWVRIFLANRAIALGWALKGSCKQCAHRLFTTARWLVPEAQRFLVHRTGSHARSFEHAVDLTLLSRIPPLGVVAGFVIVLVLLGSLDLAMRATATGTKPLKENSESQHESRTPSESQVISVSKSSEAMQGFVLETGSISPAEMHQFHYLKENLQESTKPGTEKEQKQTQPLNEELPNENEIRVRDLSRFAVAVDPRMGGVLWYSPTPPPLFN